MERDALIAKARRASQAVYLAAEEGPAADISQIILDLLAELTAETTARQSETARAEGWRAWVIFVLVDSLPRLQDTATDAQVQARVAEQWSDLDTALHEAVTARQEAERMVKFLEAFADPPDMTTGKTTRDELHAEVTTLRAEVVTLRGLVPTGDEITEVADYTRPVP